MENSIDIPLKAKDRATIWSSNPIPGHISRKDKNSNSKNYIHPNVHSSTVYNNQDMRVCSVTSVVSDSETPWTMARQAPLSMGFSRQEYWSGLPFPSPVIKYEMSEVSEVKSLSRVRLLATPWTVVRQAPMSMEATWMSTNWQIKMWCVYTLDYYSAVKRMKILPFAATWMNLELNILSKVNQTEKGK